MQPSQSELVILQQLWKNEPLSLREIHSSIEPQLNWSRSSTRKTVERMVAKELLYKADSHGLSIYHPAVRKIPTIGAMVRNFASQVLGLKAPLPVANLISSTLLDESELSELDEYLKKLDQNEKEKKI